MQKGYSSEGLALKCSCRILVRVAALSQTSPSMTMLEGIIRGKIGKLETKSAGSQWGFSRECTPAASLEATMHVLLLLFVA